MLAGGVSLGDTSMAGMSGVLVSLQESCPSWMTPLTGVAGPSICEERTCMTGQERGHYKRSTTKPEGGGSVIRKAGKMLMIESMKRVDKARREIVVA